MKVDATLSKSPAWVNDDWYYEKKRLTEPLFLYCKKGMSQQSQPKTYTFPSVQGAKKRPSGATAARP